MTIDGRSEDFEDRHIDLTTGAHTHTHTHTQRFGLHLPPGKAGRVVLQSQEHRVLLLEGSKIPSLTHIWDAV